MTFTSVEPATKSFERLSVDDRLALLWFIYTEMGGAITPAAPGAAASEIVEGLFNQVKELSYDEQLQVMRDLASRTNGTISREYGSLSPDSKLAFWYRLAQGMDDKTIVPMPSDYKMASAAEQLFTTIKGMDFQQQITLLRSSVLNMGTEAKETGI